MIPINTPTNTTFASLPPHLYKKQWPQYVLKLRNVYLGGGGAIYDENGELHPHANFTYNFWDNLHNEGARPNNTLESQDIKKNINLADYTIKELPEKKNYIYAHHYFNIYVYGHNFDVFQDLQKIEGLSIPDKILIMPPRSAHVTNLNLHLELLGYPRDRTLSLNLPGRTACDTVYRVPTLYYPSPTAYPSQRTLVGLDYLRSKYYPLCKTYPSSTKLYLQRTTSRRVKNEDEVIPLLKNKGFTILNGTEGLAEHVRQFRNASIIIGAHGSLLANLIFSEKKPRVYEACPKSREDHNFEGIGKTMKLDYHWIATDCCADYSINLDIKQLKKICQI
tara:strand:- start:27747 stop:28751 length:1005 start_codon:yes stop_codon:yes gene_type:complete